MQSHFELSLIFYLRITIVSSIESLTHFISNCEWVISQHLKNVLERKISKRVRYLINFEGKPFFENSFK